MESRGIMIQCDKSNKSVMIQCDKSHKSVIINGYFGTGNNRLLFYHDTMDLNGIMELRNREPRKRGRLETEFHGIMS